MCRRRIPETKVITSFTANRRTPSVKRDLWDINKTPETVSSTSKSNGCPMYALRYIHLMVSW